MGEGLAGFAAACMVMTGRLASSPPSCALASVTVTVRVLVMKLDAKPLPYHEAESVTLEVTKYCAW